jgi:NitT/TauT family transport system permease protein
MILLNAIPARHPGADLHHLVRHRLGSKIAISLVLVTVLMFFAVFSGIREGRHPPGGAHPHARRRPRHAAARSLHTVVTSWILGNLKVAVGFAFTGAVVGEFVAFQPRPRLPAVLRAEPVQRGADARLVLLIMGFRAVLFAIAGRLERWLLHWRYA